MPPPCNQFNAKGSSRNSSLGPLKYIRITKIILPFQKIFSACYQDFKTKSIANCRFVFVWLMGGVCVCSFFVCVFF